MANLIPFFVVALIAGCGVGRDTGISPRAPVQAPPGERTFISGSLTSTSGEKVDLGALRNQPLVLVFASDTCDVCLRESEAFRNSLKNAANPPTKVHLVTAMVGALPEDAVDWKESNRIPWTVAIDKSLSLYKQHCGGTEVPCTVVQMPEKGIVFQKIGEVHVEEIQAITGAWE